MVETIGTYEIRVSSTTYKKKLKTEIRKYEYGSISIKNPELAGYIGQTVIVKIQKSMKDDKKIRVYGKALDKIT